MKNLLIVDDDDNDRYLIKRTLAKSPHHYNISEATSVTKAVEAMKNDTFDLILLDYQLPEHDGFELLISLRSELRLGGTAIVVISSSDEPEIALKCIEAGAQDYINKNEMTPTMLDKVLLRAQKRFDIDQRMLKNYLDVKELAERDPLTGLSNRYHFEDTLKVMIANNKREIHSVALLALDLDNFKFINDSFGHAAGDQLLREVVERISSCLRENEGFARLGGDEFAIVIGGVTGPNNVASVAKRIVQKLQTPFVFYGREVYTSVSIGAAFFPGDGENAEHLLKCADIAMYRAKNDGKNKLCFFEPYYQADFHREFDIQNAIKSHLKDDRFELFYQPIFAVESNQVLGYEALIRWPHDDKMNFSPEEFIPIAERTGLISEVGHWVTDTAFKQLAAWQSELKADLTMSINVSPLQLLDPHISTFICACAKKHGISPKTVILEITETALVKDNERIINNLQSLTSYGFMVALDDFGVGYTSISQLLDYPISTVKLDKSIQLRKQNSKSEGSVVEAMSLMLKKLGIIIVAEGIETTEQFKVCKRFGIDRVQGFLLGRPINSKDAVQHL